MKTTTSSPFYTLHGYYLNVVLKTLLQKEDKMFNVTHMALGMGSEILSELPIAILNSDRDNLIEEIGDIEFFTVGYAHFEGIDISGELTPNSAYSLFNSHDIILHAMNLLIGQIQTIVKKEMISGVKKLNGVEVTHQQLTEIVHSLLFVIEQFCKYQAISLEKEVRLVNAKKLNVRYSGGGFTAQGSLNRNKQAELDAVKSSKENIDLSSRITDFNNNKITESVFMMTAILDQHQYWMFKNMIQGGKYTDDELEVIVRNISQN